MTLLKLQNIHAGYGHVKVLFGMELEINAGEIVTLLGRNGMGKTTLVKAVTGLNSAHSGSIMFAGKEISRLPAHAIGQLGVGLVPEGRHIFPTLTVRENLVATSANRLNRENPWELENVYELFPRLMERENQMGATLSGGEQQMLAIARALMTNPSLLILDEATEGLAPLIRKEIYNCVSLLKERGQSILIIDKYIAELLPIADRHFIIEKGKAVWQGSSKQFSADPALSQLHLGV
ncbi:MAG: ABC transporter ATP-binding protein [Hyphomicrobiales bacterium]|nr:MAG: ABC transporter ATP-binding protein [Hyphomicrobiales bacterium]